MLVVFSPIFVADAKIIFQYDFVAPLKTSFTSAVPRQYFAKLIQQISVFASPNTFAVFSSYPGNI